TSCRSAASARAAWARSTASRRSTTTRSRRRWSSAGTRPRRRRGRDRGGGASRSMNVAEHVARAAVHFPDKPAIVFEGRDLPYAALRARVDRLAHGLVDLGVGRGDRVALHLPNVPAFLVAYLATVAAGAVAVSVSAALTTEE